MRILAPLVGCTNRNGLASTNVPAKKTFRAATFRRRLAQNGGALFASEKLVMPICSEWRI
jgi:hypothetical protein